MGEGPLSRILLAAAVLVISVPVAVMTAGNVQMQQIQDQAQLQWQQAARRQAADALPLPFLLEIPKIHLRWLIHQGTDVATMRRYGAGHIAGTPLPGEPGVAGIAGHRTTYGAPFWRLNTLRPGDVITIRMPKTVLTYQVQSLRQVRPADVDVLHPTAPGSFLVLITCTPPYSATYRLVVRAVLHGTTWAWAPTMRGGH